MSESEKRMTVEIMWRCLWKADTAIYLCCYLSMVLTVPNSTSLRKGGDWFHIEKYDLTTNNHREFIRKEGFKRMNVKKKARRVMSGLLTAVTVLSTVLSPAVAYASDDAGSVSFCILSFIRRWSPPFLKFALFGTVSTSWDNSTNIWRYLFVTNTATWFLLSSSFQIQTFYFDLRFKRFPVFFPGSGPISVSISDTFSSGRHAAFRSMHVQTEYHSGH